MILLKVSSWIQKPPKQKRKEKQQHIIEILSSQWSSLEHAKPINMMIVLIKIKRQGKLENTIWVIYKLFNSQLSLIKETIESQTNK